MPNITIPDIIPIIKITINIVPKTFTSGKISTVIVLSSPVTGWLSEVEDVRTLISYFPGVISSGGIN